ncbi:peptidyl-prolyl cis-trans isomerase [bacterium]|nr:peptidyl-prolyl cis-trans isomerase [bacterium]
MIMLRMMSVMFLSALVFGCTNGKKVTDAQIVVLAIVGNDTITGNDLKHHIDKLNRSKIDLQNDEVRQSLLQDLVQHRLIYHNALENKLNESEDIRLDVLTKRDEIFYEKILRDYVYFAMISDEELKSLYEKLKTEVRVQQIYIGYRNPNKTFILDKKDVVRNVAEARHLIDSLHYAIAKEPELFGPLAEAYSNDENSKYLKGDVGFRRWGMQPELEKSYFELRVGELSRPIEADYGFYIFKATDRRNVENLKPYDQARPGLLDMKLSYLFRVKKAEIEKNKRRFGDSLLTEYKYTVNKSNCEKFLRVYHGIKTSAEIGTAFTDQDRALELAFFQNGKITVSELVHVMKSNTNKIKMDDRILNDGLKSVALRRIYSDVARNNGFELNDKENESLKNHEMNLMIGLAVNNLYDAMEIREKDIQDFYETNKEEYRQPGLINVSEITSPDMAALNRIADEVKKRNNFEKMYNEAQEIEGFKCSTTGLVSEMNSELIIQKAKGIAAGTVSEPFMKANREYSIIKVMDRKKGDFIPYGDLKDRVKEDYMNFKRQLTFNEWIAKLSVQHKVQIFSDRLASVFDIKMK